MTIKLSEFEKIRAIVDGLAGVDALIAFIDGFPEADIRITARYADHDVPPLKFRPAQVLPWLYDARSTLAESLATLGVDVSQ